MPQERAGNKIVVYKSHSRYRLPLGKRDRFAISSLERIQLKKAFDASKMVAVSLVALRRRRKRNFEKEKILKRVILYITRYISRLLAVEIDPDEERRRKKKPKLPHKKIDDYAYLEADDSESFSEKFRFIDTSQLKRLLVGFQFPETVIVKGYKFRSEEILLIGLTRFCYPNRWSDMIDKFPSRKRWELHAAVNYFLNFMIYNWGYLILNNREFWKPYLVKCAEAIRQKLATLPNEGYRQQHPPADEPNGFRIFGFIDNTMNATCRVGGGPLSDGEQAPRLPKEVQQAFWTGMT